MTEFMESLLQVPLRDGYGSTEAGGVWRDGVLQRPPVTDYKLVDVPELGYFTTDSPHPRGELRLKSETMFPGYYKRPETTADVFDDEGYYKTGDVVAELGPDHLKYLDRVKNVLKLAQGSLSRCQSWRPLTPAARWSGRSLCMGTVNARSCWLSWFRHPKSLSGMQIRQMRSSP